MRGYEADFWVNSYIIAKTFTASFFSRPPLHHSHFLLQRYNTPHPLWHLLAFSIRKMGKNKHVINRYSTPYKRKNIFENFPVVRANGTHFDRYGRTARASSSSAISPFVTSQAYHAYAFRGPRTIRTYPPLALQITDYSYFKTHILPLCVKQKKIYYIYIITYFLYYFRDSDISNKKNCNL